MICLHLFLITDSVISFRRRFINLNFFSSLWPRQGNKLFSIISLGRTITFISLALPLSAKYRYARCFTFHAPFKFMWNCYMFLPCLTLRVGHRKSIINDVFPFRIFFLGQLFSFTIEQYFGKHFQKLISKAYRCG